MAARLAATRGAFQQLFRVQELATNSRNWRRAGQSVAFFFCHLQLCSELCGELRSELCSEPCSLLHSQMLDLGKLAIDGLLGFMIFAEATVKTAP
jgi:hypothetical protein